MSTQLPQVSREPAPQVWAIAGWVILFKAVLLGALGLLLGSYGNYDTFGNVEVRWPEKGVPVFESHFAAWDGAHYLRLATGGYRAGISSCAFYPAWPMLIRWVSAWVTHPLAVAMVLGNLFSALATAVFVRTTWTRFGARTARWSAAALLCQPGALFFHVPYSESLFLLVLMLLWNGIERDRFTQAALAAFLLPLVRGVGLFILIPLAWNLLREQAPQSGIRLWDRFTPRIAHWRSILGPASTRRLLLGQPHAWLILLMPIVGWTVYLGFMAVTTGNPWEGIEAQKYWGHRHSMGNLIHLPKFILEYFNPTAVHEFAGSVLDRLLFIPVIATAWWSWHRNRDLFPWILCLGVLPAMSGSFTSFTRFVAVAFPCAIAHGVLLTRTRSWGLFLLVLGAVIQGLLLWRFANFEWAG